MTSRSILCFVAVALSASSACAEEETELTLKQSKQLLEAISIFAEAPLSGDGQRMASIIAKYADGRQDGVVIVGLVMNLDLGVHAWLVEKPEVKHKQTLRAAVIAGQLQYYLTAVSAKNPTREALLFLFEIYNKLKANDKEFSVPMIEEQIQAHKNGKLSEYILKHGALFKIKQSQGLLIGDP